MQHWQRLVGMFAIVALGFAAASAAPVGFDDAVSWWRFGNDLTDSNAPASNGTVVNGAVTYAAVSRAGAYSNGVAAAFNGDRIHVPAGAGTELDTDGFGGLTTFIRVDPDVRSGTGGQCVLNRDGYDSAERVFSLEIGNTATQGRVLWRAWGDSSSGAIDLTTADIFAEPGFHDVVGVFRPGVGTEVYVNGKLRATRAVTYTALTAGGTVPVSIGNRAFTNFPYYGDLESAAVWSQALEPIDIKRLTVGRLNQTHAAAWLRFGGDYNDSNTPPASNGTPGGSASLISAPSAPDHMGNDMAARLDGTNDYVNLGLGGSNELDIDGSDGLTIFARVYPHRTATGAIVSRDGFAGYVTGYNNYRSFNLSTFGTSGPHFRVWSGGDEFMVSAVPSGFYPDWANNWHDLVSVFRPGEALEIYIDGVLLASTPLSITSINQPLDIHGNPVAINIGRAHLTGSGGWYYDGDIESVAIWGYDLTPTEIQLLSVPEPATLGLVGAGLLALARRRRRV